MIIFDQNKINEELFTNYMKNMHKYLKFKLTEEESNIITYLDFSIHRNNNDLHLDIHRSPTQTDTTIHITSNHPLEHKLAAYNCYVNSMITQQSRNKQSNKNGILSSQ
jgi:hypothetical protein